MSWPRERSSVYLQLETRFAIRQAYCVSGIFRSTVDEDALGPSTLAVFVCWSAHQMYPVILTPLFRDRQLLPKPQLRPLNSVTVRPPFHPPLLTCAAIPSIDRPPTALDELQGRQAGEQPLYVR
jgi:hypothetical protein